ncbi:hypothetical protein AAG906_008920 [Vitis piasezkii]
MKHVDKHAEESLHNAPFNMRWVTFNEVCQAIVASGCASKNSFLLFAIPLFFSLATSTRLIFSSSSTIFSSLDSSEPHRLMLLPLVQLVRAKKWRTGTGTDHIYGASTSLSRNLPTPYSLSRSNSTQGSAFLFLHSSNGSSILPKLPDFYLSKSVRVLMGCYILDMLLHLDLSLLEVLLFI